MVDLTILMPCLNEADAVAACVREAQGYLQRGGLTGEVLVVDNGSTDGSAQIARECGARVVREERRGYGRALRTGLSTAEGRLIVLGDCDTTYDFSALDELVGLLASGTCDLVVGDRFAGGVERGAMPLSHHVGVKALSALARWRYRCDVRDFHCGLRGITKNAADRLPFTADGMEFATEMIAVAAARGLRMGQVPVKLRCCAARRQSKLRTVPDGFRHLRYIMGNSRGKLAAEE